MQTTGPLPLLSAPAEQALPDNNPKTRFGIKKTPLHLVPPAAVKAEAEAFADGANKYGPYNWREKGVSASVYIAACKRHLDDWWDGQQRASDSGVHHLGHARACLAIIIDAETFGNLNDDRPIPMPYFAAPSQ